MVSTEMARALREDVQALQEIAANLAACIPSLLARLERLEGKAGDFDGQNYLHPSPEPPRLTRSNGEPL